jgi:hypothetical protein
MGPLQPLFLSMSERASHKNNRPCQSAAQPHAPTIRPKKKRGGKKKKLLTALISCVLAVPLFLWRIRRFRGVHQTSDERVALRGKLGAGLDNVLQRRPLHRNSNCVLFAVDCKGRFDLCVRHEVPKQFLPRCPHLGPRGLTIIESRVWPTVKKKPSVMSSTLLDSHEIPVYSMDGIVAFLLLLICTCAYMKRIPRLKAYFLSEKRGFFGVFYKCACPCLP